MRMYDLAFQESILLKYLYIYAIEISQELNFLLMTIINHVFISTVILNVPFVLHFKVQAIVLHLNSGFNSVHTAY